jgi:predicted RNA-binding protein YlxR (DUF448 family)
MLAGLHHHGGDADAGPRTRGVTERMCVATRTVKPVGEMIRFVVAPDGVVVPDLKCRLPGRGVWVTATREALTQAIKRKAIGPSLKREVRLVDLAGLTERLLERAALDALAICRKASLAVAGFTKVEAAMMQGRVMALLHASDAADDGIRKLGAALRRRPDHDAVRIIRDFSSDQLDLALALPNVVHAALLTGSSSDAFLARHARLTRFRTGAFPQG